MVFQALSLFQKQKPAPPGNDIRVSLSVNSPVRTGQSSSIKWNLDQRSRFMSRSERVSYIGLANQFEQHRQIWCSGFWILVALFYMHLITADTTADGFHFRSKGVRESKIKGVWIISAVFGYLCTINISVNVVYSMCLNILPILMIKWYLWHTVRILILSSLCSFQVLTTYYAMLVKEQSVCKGFNMSHSIEKMSMFLFFWRITLLNPFCPSVFMLLLLFDHTIF